ncbi:MAG: alpha/beta fold hydrolase [Kiritimatiellae bacterium]|nr:alpha/beta fold hydrolase [Kiritimatiellia bacterium]
MPTFVLNGWAASPHAWDLCRFSRDFLFSYVEQLDGVPEKAVEKAGRCVLVGWSMGGSSALRLFCRFPGKVAGLVLVAATPRMMAEKESGWVGMSPRRLEALRYGVAMTRGEGFFGVPEGRPNPYLADAPENLARGLKYLFDTDLRPELGSATSGTIPIYVFQSERDGIVRAENAAYLKSVFPQANVRVVPGSEHALPIFIPELIDEAVDSCVRLAASGQDIARPWN